MSERVETRILHADDDPGVAELTAEVLERENDRFTVESVTSADAGLARLSDTSYDCILSDYDMPGQNGIEFLEAVRKRHPDLPFILYTAKGDEKVASDAISAGVTDYLQKTSGTSQYTVLANRIRNAVERRQIKSELADREKRLNLFFEQSPLGVIEWDQQFNFARLNAAAEETLGYTKEELIGRSWETIVPEAERDGVNEDVSALLTNAGGYQNVNRNLRADGEQIICEWHNGVVTDNAGSVVAVFSQFQDITERRQNQRRFEAMFNNAQTFTGLMEPDGTVIKVNDTALSVGGLDREDVIGKRLDETAWIRPNSCARTTVQRAIEQARNGDTFRDEIRMQGSDRSVLIDFSVRPVTDDHGEITLLVPEGRDIPEQDCE